MASEYTLLALVTEFCKRNGLPIPVTVAGAQDDTTLQIWGAANEGIMDIADRYNLQQLQTLLTFQHANGDNYLAYDFGTNTPDWKFLIPQTFWCATQRIRVAGPLTLVEFQTLTNMLIATSLYNYIIFGNAIHIFGVPTPPSGTTFSVFYQSKYGVIDSTAVNSTNPSGFTDQYLTDQSIPRLPSYMLLADLNWRWKAKKGLPYAEDQRVFEQMLAEAVNRSDEGTLILDAPEWIGSQIGPGLLIPAGNWPLH